MNLNVGSHGGLRRAALTLHALGVVDRDWLLQRLPAPDRDTLLGLLGELRELEIPADAEVIRVALNEAAATTEAFGVQAAALGLALATEPAALQSQLLAMLGEAERESVLARWPQGSTAVPAAVADPAWTPTLRETLLQSWREAAVSADRRTA